MKSHHYVAIFLRCVSIVLLVYGLSGYLQLIRAIDESFGVSLFISLMIFAFPFLIAALCWFFPVTASKIIIPIECDKDVEPISRQALTSIFIAVIGIYAFVSALPDALYWLVLINMGSALDGLSYSLEDKANLAATALELLLAVLLIVKAKSIASYVTERS